MSKTKARKNTIIYSTHTPIINKIGKKINFPKRYVRVLKKHQYCVMPQKLSGDAPKDFIYIYEYGRCRKKNLKTYIGYIAKIGHKWYPMESITEHLLTRLGQEWGFRIANSKLYVILGQVRFCSEFFRKSNQELVHGADILSIFLEENSSEIINEIDKAGWSQELLTFDVVIKAIKTVFSDEVVNGPIIKGLVDMLLFDSIVGNNDRHFFNGGVLRSLTDTDVPCFSPIYDSARGLFWNYSDQKIVNLYVNNRVEAEVQKYHKQTSPKIGWEGDKNINHIAVVTRLLENGYLQIEQSKMVFSSENLEKFKYLMKTEFKDLFLQQRKDLILRFLEYRFDEFNKVIFDYENNKSFK
jgi:hypothetical protein